MFALKGESKIMVALSRSAINYSVSFDSAA